MERYDIRIPYIEIRDENTREIIGMVEGAEIFFEYNFHDSGSFEIYCRADDNAIELLKKDRYVTLPVNADSVTNLIEQNSNMWTIQKIQKTNDVAGGRWIVATGKETKQIVDKRIIRNTAKLDRNSDVSTEIRTKLFTPNLLQPTDTKRLINGFVFTENTVGVNITQDTQVTYDNLFTYTEELYKLYGVGAKLRLDRNSKNMIYTIYKGVDRSNDIIFSRGNDNLLKSDYIEDWAEYKTSALVGGEEKEEVEVDPDTGETLRKYKTRTMVVVEDNSTDTDRCEVFVDAKDLQSSYNEDVNGESVERTYTPAVYKSMLKARGKEKLASENNVVREFNGEIDTVNNKKTFNIDYYLGDLIKIRDEDLQREIVVRISKFVKVQNDEGYKEYFEYEEFVETTEEEIEGALLTEDGATLLTEDDKVLLIEEVPTTFSTMSLSTASTSGVRISELDEATNVTDGCCFPIVSEYETKKISYGDLTERLSNDFVSEAYVNEQIDNKVDKVEGKGLSTNDYTNDEKNKLASLENYDDTAITNQIDILNTIADEHSGQIEQLDTNKADKTEISDFITKDVDNLTNYTIKTETGTDISLSIDPTTYVMTLQLKNSEGTIISSGNVDLPLETMVIGASYSDGTLTLTLKNGQTLDIDISSLISGLVPDTRTIADIDLKDNITKSELKTALDVDDIETAVSNKADKTQLNDYVKFTDYAGINKAGTVKIVDYSYGFNVLEDGTAYVIGANRDDIAKKESFFRPITPMELDYATKLSITTNTHAMTDEEKASFQNWTGTASQNDVPTKTSDLTNDSDFITSTETDTKIQNELSSYVPNERKVNGIELSSDVNLSANDLKRITLKDVGGSTYRYYPFIKFPLSYNDSNNNSSVIVYGRMGGQNYGYDANVNMILSNKDYEGGSINIMSNGNTSLFYKCDIEIYRQSDNTAIAYLRTSADFIFDLNVNLYESELIYDGTYINTPLGERKWGCSTAYSRFALYGNSLRVGSKTVATTDQIPDTSTFVPTSRKINGNNLTDDITLNASDVGALPDTTVIPTQTGQLENTGDGTVGSKYATESQIQNKADKSSINKQIVEDVGIKYNTQNTLTLNIDYTNLYDGKTLNHNVTFPNANAEKEGLMSPASYNQINNNTSRIEQLESTAGKVFTNTESGSIKGSTTDGNVSANADGTGSVSGWTELKEIVSNKAEKTEIPTTTNELTNNSGFITKDVNNLTNYTVKTETGTDIALSIDTTNYVMTLQLKNSAGTVISTGTVDLPLETMVIGASYENGILTLTLKNGQSLDIDISSLISGLVPETRTIAGIDLKDNITKTEMKTALDVDDLETSVSNKVDKVTGKQLSTNDYTTTEKNKLAGIEVGAEVNDVNSVNGKTGTVVLSASDVGALASNGNAVSATKATQDGDGNVISTTYAKISDIPQGSVLYNEKGQATNGAMTQKATTDELNSIINNTSVIANSQGGFKAGLNSVSEHTGVAIGNEAEAEGGGASVGASSKSAGGGAVGMYAQTETGGAVGYEAQSIDGFAGGSHAKATAYGSVQLGEGTNNTAGTLQYMTKKIADNNGKLYENNVDISTIYAKKTEIPNTSNLVPNTRKVNGKALSSDITLSASDVSALPSSTVIPSKTSQLTNDSGFLTSAPVTSVNSKTGAVSLSASDVSAVPTTRTVNGKALSSNITLSASDVGALPSSTTIPTALSQLTADSTHRVVTDTQITNWNNKATKETYSTSETATNSKWIDGRTIYRKVFTISNAGSPTYVAHNISNLDLVINVYGVYKSGGVCQPIQRVVTDNVGQYGIGFGDINSGNFFLQLGWGVSTTNTCYVILEYVKN